MPAPPESITVKRKRRAEDAPHFLRLEPSKRHKHDGLLYQIESNIVVSAVQLQPPTKPVIHLSASSRPVKSLKKPRVASKSPTPTPSGAAERRFVLKRKNHDHHINQPSATDDRGIVFIERQRRLKQQCSRSNLVKSSPSDDDAPSDTATAPSTTTPPKKYKRPGTRSRRMSPEIDEAEAKAGAKAPPKPTVPDPSSFPAFKELQEWAMKESELLEVPKTMASPRPMRFKPTPIKRFAERHSDYIPPKQKPKDAMMTNTRTGEEESDEDDYVIETYVRVPAELAQTNPGRSIGQLVLEDDEDVDFFYENQGDTDSDFDDEDSNDENYYANDYPDEDNLWFDNDDLDAPGLDDHDHEKELEYSALEEDGDRKYWP